MKKLIAAAVVAALAGAAWHEFKTPDASHAAGRPQAVTPREHNVLRFPADAPQLAYLRIVPASAGQVPALEPLQGHVAYDEDATSRITTPIAGRVTKISAQPGDSVKAGQALLTLDSPDFAQAGADVRKAESDAHLKQAAFERAKTLLDGGVLARKDLESAETDFQQASIELDRARARLKNLGPAGGSGFVLTTRVSGVVTERQVNPGSEVRPDNPAPLFVVSNPQRLWINVEVPERNLGKIREGQHLRVESDAYPDTSFDAEVLMTGKVLDPATRRVIVRCRVDNREEKLKPEMYVHATPLGSEAILPHVPNDALVVEGLQSFLFVERAPGVIEKRRVTLGYRGHEESYVADGLKAGERVVASGALLLNAEFSGS